MKHLSICLIMILSITLGVNSHVVAEDLYESDPLSFEVTKTKEEFIANSLLYDEVPFNDELLAYKIYLPKDWKKIPEGNLENIALNSWVLGEVAKFFSPPVGDDRSSFSVKALEMKKYMSVDKWFRSFMSVQGGFISNIKIFSSNLLHAEYNTFEEGKNYFVRAVVQRSLGRVILTEYKVPVMATAKFSDDQKWSMTLFRLKNVDYSFDSFADIYTYLNVAEHLYPKEWEVAPGNYDTVDELFYKFGRIKLEKYRGRIVDRGMDESLGVLNTVLLSKRKFSSPDDKITEAKEEQEEYTFEDKVLEEIDRGVGNKTNTVAFYPTQVYKSQSLEDKDNQEFWVGVNESANSFFIVYMLIPNRYYDYNLWAENVGAFDLMLKSFQPL